MMMSAARTTDLKQRLIHKGKYPGTTTMRIVRRPQENIFAKRRTKRRDPTHLVTLLGLFLLILTTLIVATDLVLSFVRDSSKANLEEDVLVYDESNFMNSNQQDRQQRDSRKNKMTMIGRTTTTGKRRDGRRRKRSGMRRDKSRHDSRRHHHGSRQEELEEEAHHHPRPTKQDHLNKVASSSLGQPKGSNKSDTTSSSSGKPANTDDEEPKKRKDDTEGPPYTKDNNSNGHKTTFKQDDDAAANPPQQQQQQVQQDDHPTMMTIHLAAAAGNLELVRKHVEQTSEGGGKEMVNLKDPNGWTPLHEAARAGRLAVIQYLVENGADKNVLTGNGESPLWLIKHSNYDFDRPPLVKYMQEDLGALEVGPRDL